MTPRIILGRAAALGSAVLLFGAYVWHQGCAAPADRNVAATRPATPQATTQPAAVRLIGGSKSRHIMAPGENVVYQDADVTWQAMPTGPSTQPAPKPPVLIHGTKRAAVFEPPPSRHLMPGSKSADISVIGVIPSELNLQHGLGTITVSTTRPTTAPATAPAAHP